MSTHPTTVTTTAVTTAGTVITRVDPLSEFRRIIQDLLSNPYPHDLMEIRRQVREDYGGNEEEAGDDMFAYCTEQFALDALDAHYAAVQRAQQFLKDTSP